MKRFPFFATVIAVLLTLPYLSCKSTQPATTEPPATDAPSSVELQTAIARSEEARQRTIDFESPSYFPSEWDAAEEKYVQAKHTEQQGSLRMSITAYEDVATAFDSVFRLTIPLYAQAREDEIVALRDNLIAAGGRDLYPEPLSAADKVALTALEQYEAKAYYPAKNSADQALTMYQTLTNAYNAWLVRREIEERRFIRYDPDNFERAGEVLNNAMSDYGSEDYSSAYKNANEALNRYNLVLSAGWAANAEQYAARAAAARQVALYVKADVAVRGIYGEADTSYKNGTSAMNTENYAEAARLFYDADGLFNAATVSAKEKRDIAEQAIEDANKKLEESDETARIAEAILEGGAE